MINYKLGSKESSIPMKMNNKKSQRDWYLGGERERELKRERRSLQSQEYAITTSGLMWLPQMLFHKFQALTWQRVKALKCVISNPIKINQIKSSFCPVCSHMFWGTALGMSFKAQSFSAWKIKKLCIPNLKQISYKIRFSASLKEECIVIEKTHAVILL